MTANRNLLPPVICEKHKEKKMKTIAIVGFGSRGRMFASLIVKDKNAKLVAIADIAPACRDHAKEKFGLTDEQCYLSADHFFEQGKICDAIFLCTQDAQHHEMAIKALELGYDICLEKPAAVTTEECIDIRDTANRLGRKVMLTHVLRYAPFYQYIKKTIMSGVLGDIATITQTENIAYWHFALSYVRGPWRNMKESSPTIIAKCCHDLDILKWLMDKKCTTVSSFGSLFHYKPENAPCGSAEWCADCNEETRNACLYNAYRIYPERMKRSVVGGTARLLGKDIVQVLDEKEDIIGKCVYHAGSDAIDNQAVNMLFEDNSTAHLTMTAFSQQCYRYINVHGTKGEIYGDAEEEVLYLQIYGEEKQRIDVEELVKNEDVKLSDGHGGGDYFLYKDFMNYITENSPSFTRTTIDDSIESHIMGFKAEESRLNNGAPQFI